MSPADIQLQLAREIVGDRLKTIPDIKPAGTLEIHEAFEVYAEGYIARLTESLGETYESVWRILGDEEFFRICENYINEHPSHDYNINQYGKDFAGWIESYSVEMPFLTDIAKMDYEFLRVFHLRAPNLKDTISFAAFENSDAKAEFGNSWNILKTEFDIYNFWLTLRSDSDESQYEEPENSGTHILFYKTFEGVFIRKLSEAENCLIKSLRQLTFSSALEASDLNEIEVAEFFRFLTESEILVGIK